MKTMGLLLTLVSVTLLSFGISYADVDISEETRLDSKAVPDSVEVSLPKIGNGNGDVLVIWQSDNAAPYDIWGDISYNRSTDNGGTWLDSEGNLSLGMPQPQGQYIDASMAAICMDSNGNVYVAAKTYLSGQPGDVVFRHSADNGATWGEKKTLTTDISDLVDGSYQISPKITCDENGRVYVVWRAWDGYLHLNYSTNYGETWLEESIAFGPQDEVLDIAIASDNNGNLNVVWVDKRDVEPYNLTTIKAVKVSIVGSRGRGSLIPVMPLK